MEVTTMEAIISIAQKVLEAVSAGLFAGGEFEASGIVALVKTFLENFDIVGFVTKLIALVG